MKRGEYRILPFGGELGVLIMVIAEEDVFSEEVRLAHGVLRCMQYI